MLIRALPGLECTRILTANRVGHLACARDGQPYVVPFYYAHSDAHLYAFSMPGKKIEWKRANPLFAVEVDERGHGRGWKSVVVDGRYEELPDRIGHKIQRDRAWSVLSKHSDWLEPGALKPLDPAVADSAPHVFFQILIEQVSGREASE
ncbi:pyridoxamine 5'-phosphate oxidase family protein [Mesorhizobium sp. ORM6]